MKNVIVCGANGGMGTKVCSLLAQNGYKIFALDITPTAGGDNIIPIIADITDEQSLQEAKKQVLSHTDKLFAIINLAGFFAMDSIVCGSIDKLRKAFEVNFWGAYNVNKVFFNLLSKDSRIVVMSSELARYSMHPFDGYYALPKVTVDNYCDCLRRESKFLGIKVVKIQAGSFSTNMTMCAEKEFNELKENATDFKQVLKVFDKFVGNELKKGNDAQIVAKTVLKILQAKTPKICYRVKNSFKLGLINALPEKTQDALYPLAVKILGNKKGEKD